MDQKIKVGTAVTIFTILVIAVIVYLFGIRNNSIQAEKNPQVIETKIPLQEQKNSTPVSENKTVVGKVRSMNDKQVFIELNDGTGSAINISAKTPVRKEGDSNIGNLSILKVEAQVSVNVDSKDNAIEILIKK